MKLYRVRLTSRQRENLGKASLNFGNAILVAWVLSNAFGQTPQPRLLGLGVMLYLLAIVMVLWIDR